MSVIIPAHQEEHVLGRCLDALLGNAAPGEFDVVVVCNGCTDRTAEVAGRYGDRLRVLQTPIAGKVHALRTGEEQVTAFPRIYLDADVELSTEAARRMAAALAAGDRLVAVPRPLLDGSLSSGLVRRYARVQSALPSVRHQLGGAGAYALGAAGRRRLGELPDVLADDGYVVRRFAPAERVVVESARAVVRLPVDVGSLIRRRGRVHAGNAELARLARAGADLDQPPRTGLRTVGSLVSTGRVMLPDAIVFVAVTACSRALHQWRRIRRSTGTWAVDGSSRVAPGPLQ